jgi:hypothetical protein
VPVRIEPEPSDDVRRAILAALALEEGRNPPAPLSVEKSCAADAENILPGPPKSPSARSA